MRLPRILKAKLDAEVTSGTVHVLNGGGTGAPGDLIQEILGMRGANRPASDGYGVECKWHGGKSQLTLFHKTPTGGVQTILPLVLKYGTLRDNVLSWRPTVRNGAKTRGPLKFEVVPGKAGSIQIHTSERICIANWSKAMLEEAANKLRNTVLVYGKMTGKANDKIRTVQYTSYRYCTDFCGIDNFISLIFNGTLAMEFCTSKRAEKKTVRDHGTKVRIAHRQIERVWDTFEPHFDPPPIIKPRKPPQPRAKKAPGEPKPSPKANPAAKPKPKPPSPPKQLAAQQEIQWAQGGTRCQ